ncbi:restriction endonuclease subunit S [Pseudomonas mandelii]|uniref:restriction endonuclease subunit S n=1 Tax=Pseudomonas mandelii TaxID=75612 RepID=UPI00224A58D4|nr:restriction endonuclease subunit S [Pseudomonas mandelii]MCX2896659.1 restriction endonuclease subunit S [Pseudomonas mandelii]
MIKATLSEICSIQSGGTPSRGAESYWGGSIPWAKISDLEASGDGYISDTEEYITKEGLEAIRGRVFDEGTLLFAMYGSVGKTAIVKGLVSTNQAILGIKPETNTLELSYLKFWLRSQQAKFNRDAQGVAQKNLSAGYIRALEIPLPPLPEQKRIAAILDKADAIRRKRQQAIQFVDDLLRAVFLDMFGDPVTNPKGWEIKSIKEMAVVTTGNTPPRDNLEYYGDFIEWIKSDNINTPSDLLTPAAEYLSEVGYKAGRRVAAGSTLLTCIAGSFDCIGNAAYVDREVAFNQQINALTPKFGVNGLFLYALVKYCKKLIQAASTNSMKGMISKGKLEEVRFICPPESLQIKFEEAFYKHRSVREGMESSLVGLNDNISSLSHMAFSGQL